VWLLFLVIDVLWILNFHKITILDSWALFIESRILSFALNSWFLGFVLNIYPQQGHHNLFHLMNISHIWQRLCPLPYRLELDGFAALWRIHMPLQVIIQFTFPSKIITYGKCLENSVYIELWRLLNKHQRYIFILTLLSRILLIFQVKLRHWYGNARIGVSFCHATNRLTFKNAAKNVWYTRHIFGQLC